MVAWSSFGRVLGINLLKNRVTASNLLQDVKFSTSKALRDEHKSFVLQPSRWQYHKFKDMFHYYAMVGLIPACAILFYCNVFIGPAELQPLPTDRKVEHWEYYSHPLTRFIARYIHHNPQQEYEKFMHCIDEEAQRGKLRALENEIKRKMAERQDYQAFYYKPLMNKYMRVKKQTGDELFERLGDNYKD